MTRLWMEVLAMCLIFALMSVVTAHTQERVTVRLPDGRMVEVDDTPERRWWHSEHLNGYEPRFYYVPEQRIYQVYDNPRTWPAPARWEASGDRTYAVKEMPAGKIIIREGCPPGMPSYGDGTPCR